MLADEILASKDLKHLGAGFGKLEKDLRNAQRFVIAQDLAEAADEVSESNMRALRTVAELFRLPFDTCWFEVAQSFRPNFVNKPLHPGSYNGVSRVGLLARRESENAYRLHLFWNFADGSATGSWMSHLFTPGAPGELSRHADEDTRRKFKGADLPAALDLQSYFAPSLSHYHEDLGKGLISSREGRARLDKILEETKFDWAGEIQFWISVVALLNGRNVVDEIPADLEKVNRARRRRGKPELLSNVECRISNRSKARAAHRGGEGGGQGVRGHFVRGHFKARKSGIYWWCPFSRGDLSKGFVNKTYVASGSAPQETAR